MNPARPRQSRKVRDGILDRFIPPRSLQSSELCWAAAAAADADVTVDVTAQSILEKDLRSDRGRTYRRLLGDALFGEGRSSRVLPLGLGGLGGLGHDAGAVLETAGRGDGVRDDWPVRPRRDPLVGVPKMSVCLPEMPKVHASRARMDQLMAWGACGVLAVAGRRDVFLWRRAVDADVVGATELLVHFTADNRPMSLCWSSSPERALLAIGVGRAGHVQMWDCDLKKKLVSRRLPAVPAPVNAMSWHPYEELIAMGTCHGTVFVVTAALSVVRSVRVFEPVCGGVAVLSFSPDGGLLACGGAAGQALVWDWASGEVRGDEVEYSSTITSLCWHPWRSTVVAVGTLAGDIALLNFTTRRTITATYKGSTNRPVSVTAMSFSERTAELVVAFAGRGVSQVAVLSNLTTVVDRLKVHQDSVHYICWSPDGTILATAGADEMLCMWNFLGDKATKELRRRALQESREDRSGIRRQFGCIIR